MMMIIIVLQQLNKLEQAVEDCTAAINLDEGYVKAYLRRAKCYQSLEQHEEAVRDYEKVAKLDRSVGELKQRVLMSLYQIHICRMLLLHFVLTRIGNCLFSAKACSRKSYFITGKRLILNKRYLSSTFLKT